MASQQKNARRFLLAPQQKSPGAYVAFGPYHDDRTWNLMRNSADIKVIQLPSQVMLLVLGGWTLGFVHV